MVQVEEERAECYSPKTIIGVSREGSSKIVWNSIVLCEQYLLLLEVDPTASFIDLVVRITS